MTAETRSGRIRLFVAITVPDVVREAVLRIQGELQRLAPGHAIRWSNPEQFHLTLRVLGDVSSSDVAGLQESLRAACAGVAPLHLRAQGIGFFPSARSPRVIWVGIGDREDRLAFFQKTIESAVQPYTAEPGGERFAGHVTLGRFREHKRLNLSELIGHAGLLQNQLFGEWTADEIEIIRSELLPGRARYRSLAVCELETRLESS
jgi:2'-5' RNA ligase